MSHQIKGSLYCHLLPQKNLNFPTLIMCSQLHFWIAQNTKILTDEGSYCAKIKNFHHHIIILQIVNLI